jgi:hypothetical protein
MTQPRWVQAPSGPARRVRTRVRHALPAAPNGPRATAPNGPRATAPNGPRAAAPNGPRATAPNGPRAAAPNGPRATDARVTRLV